MEFNEIVSLLKTTVGEETFLLVNDTAIQPFVEIRGEDLRKTGSELFRNERLYFDYLACITGIDNGPAAGTMEVIYHFNSIPFGHSLTIKIVLDRNTPSVPTLSDIWRTADWHEREIFDLFGINFEGHEDLRRILLPADWEGYPLRKDYQEQAYYHGIKVKYEDRDDPGADAS